MGEDFYMCVSWLILMQQVDISVYSWKLRLLKDEGKREIFAVKYKTQLHADCASCYTN